MSDYKTLLIAVKAWLEAHTLTKDTGFYSLDEWKARGETIGRGVLNIAAEGSESLSRIYNYPESKADTLLCQEFQRLAESHGYWIEQGYHWSWHFYPLEK